MRLSTLVVTLAVAALASACTRPASPAPAEEFLVAAGDSTYWVETGRAGVHVRGAPLTLARIGGRFHEVYLADDDRSFENAVFVSPRVFRRDLVTGDSAVVWEDSAFAGVVARYAARHPTERRLDEDEEAPEDPDASSTADFGLIDLHGPYLSYEQHTDVEHADSAAWHATRRGVLDLRTGERVSVGRLFGDTAAARVLRQGRRSYLAALDSVVASSSEGARRAARSLGDFHFDPTSFTLTDLAGAPAVAFHAPGRGEGTAGAVTLPLSPIVVGESAWWRDGVRPELPQSGAAEGRDRWSHRGNAVEARYDSTGTRAELVLLDGAGREWRLVHVGVPVYRIHWLDAAALDSVGRRRLVRAFDEASQQDETARVAALHARPRRDGARLAGARPRARPSTRRAPFTRS